MVSARAFALPALSVEDFIDDSHSLSRYHLDNPYCIDVNGQTFDVHYWPGDSKSGMFGGNSNWRGPIWLATTFLIIESLQRFHQVRRAFLFVDRWDEDTPTRSSTVTNSRSTVLPEAAMR